MLLAISISAGLLILSKVGLIAATDCGQVDASYFDQCVDANAPLCKGYTQRQFQIKCCDTGVPIPDKAGCGFRPAVFVNCGTVSSDKFTGCVEAYSPLCEGMTPQQFNDNCCPLGKPNTSQTGCSFTKPF